MYINIHQKIIKLMKSKGIISETFVIGSCFSLGIDHATAVIKKEPAEKPNFIFIFADDPGWGDLGCYGNKDIKTPYLDHMAQKMGFC